MINGKISILKNYDGEPTFPITSSDAVMDGDASVKERIEDINRQLDDLKNNSDSNEYATKSELEEVFQSVSNGKSLIAEAITDKGVETSATDTFKAMAQNIEKIQGGENTPVKTEELISSGNYIRQTHTVGTKMNVESIMSTDGVGLKDENGAYHLRYKVDNDVPKTDVRCDETIYDFTIPYPLVGDENVFNEIRKNKENGKFEYVRRVNSSNIEPIFKVPPIPYSYNGCRSSNTVYIKERDAVCIVGGWSTGSSSGQKSKTTSLYDFATDSWIKLADFPLNVGIPLVGYHDGKIYVFGGYVNSYSKTLYRLDLDKNVWENITSLISPTSMLEGYGGSCVTYGDDMFLINFGRTDNACYRYNVVDNTMTTITPPSSMTTSSGNSVIHNGILYSVSKNGVLIKYDIANNVWEEIPRTDGKYFPRTSLVLVEDKIYSMGGDVRYKDRHFGKSFACYDITNGTFHDLEDIRLMYSNPYLFYRNNKIYSIGGYSYARNNPEIVTSSSPSEYVPHHWYIYDLITEESYGYPVYDDLRVNDLIKADNELIFTTNDRSNPISYNLDTHTFESTDLNCNASDTRMVFYKNRLYCFGYSNNLRIIDWDNKTVISSKLVPYTLNSKNVRPILYNGMIYVNTSSSSNNLMLMYNPDDGSIVEITCTVPLYNKAYLCATLCGDKIYYFGGGNKEVYAFSPKIKEFEKLADMPLPLNRAICVALNELIYVIGGYTSSGVSNKIFIYDTKNDSWSESVSIPNTMTGGGVIDGNYCYLASGTSQGTESSGHGLYRGSVLYKLKLSEITPIVEEVIELDQDFDMLSKKHITGITSLVGETTMKVGIDVEVP